MQGKIIKGIAGFYYVHVERQGIYECKAKGIFRKDHKKPLVGDDVELDVLDEVQKKGNIRLLIGGRCSFTNRSIIVPDLSLRIDEIKLSYHALVELLQQTIVNILKHTYNCTYSKAYSIWYKAQLFPNPVVRQIIQNLIDYTGGIKMLVNRNPSIQYGSILCMRCIGINDTFTMSMPLQVNMALHYGDIVDVLL